MCPVISCGESKRDEETSRCCSCALTRACVLVVSRLAVDGVTHMKYFMEWARAARARANNPNGVSVSDC